MNRLAKIISNLFHPLLSFTWGALILLIYTPLVVLPSIWRIGVFLEVVFTTFLLPVVIIILMSKLGVIKHGVALRNRKDRILPLIVQLVLYSLLTVMLTMQGMPKWTMFVYYGACMVAGLYSLVTFFWKISAHAGCNAALATVSLILYYEYPSITPLFLPLMLIVMTGVVSTIRVYLGRHTLAQVGVGALAGTFLMTLSYLICVKI